MTLSRLPARTPATQAADRACEVIERLGADGERHAIPPTLLISALALVPDVERTVTMDLNAAGDVLFVVGAARDELGGSAWARRAGRTDGLIPQPVADARAACRAVCRAMQQGRVRARHDVSEGR